MAAWADLRERLAALPEPPAASIYRTTAPGWFTDAAKLAAETGGPVIVNYHGCKLADTPVIVSLSEYERLTMDIGE